MKRQTTNHFRSARSGLAARSDHGVKPRTRETSSGAFSCANTAVQQPVRSAPCNSWPHPEALAAISEHGFDARQNVDSSERRTGTGGEAGRSEVAMATVGHGDRCDLYTPTSSRTSRRLDVAPEDQQRLRELLESAPDGEIVPIPTPIADPNSAAGLARSGKPPTGP
jgi:hypothetical protein